MSLQSVRQFLSTHAPDLEVIEADGSTATVTEAARIHGVEPGQIAKTLSLWLEDEVVLLVLSGEARIDNRKFRDQFQCKARMLSADEVPHWTSHPIGGVCPFGLPQPLRVFADMSLKRFEVVLPAAGATNAALRMPTQRLVDLVRAQWVDVSQPLRQD